MQLVLDRLPWWRNTMCLSQVCSHFAKQINPLLFSPFFPYSFSAETASSLSPNPSCCSQFQSQRTFSSAKKKKVSLLQLKLSVSRLSVENCQCAVFRRIVTSCTSTDLFFFFSFYFVDDDQQPKPHLPPYFPAARFPMRQKAKWQWDRMPLSRLSVMCRPANRSPISSRKFWGGYMLCDLLPRWFRWKWWSLQKLIISGVLAELGTRSSGKLQAAGMFGRVWPFFSAIIDFGFAPEANHSRLCLTASV